MREPEAARRLVFGVLLAVLLGVMAAVAFRRAEVLNYDFHYFYRDAVYVWQHGALNPQLPDLRLAMDGDLNRARRQLPFYLPVVPLLLAPLAALSVAGAATVWTLLHVTALGVSLRTLWRWATLGAVATALTLALPAVFEVARFNQLSFVVLALVVLGVDSVIRGRTALGGALLGFATVLKLLPGVFLIWLALKREWRALGVAVSAAAAIAIVPCLLVFGPPQTATYHWQWAEYNLAGKYGGPAAPGAREHFTDYRNQSIAAVVSRLCWTDHPQRAPWQPLSLSRATCTAISAAATAVLAGALLWTARQPGKQLSSTSAYGEAAVFALAMLIFAPLLRQYYLIWALPALVMLSAAGFGHSAARGSVGKMDPARRNSRTDSGAPGMRMLGWLGVGLWLVGMLAWTSPAARACGAHLALLIAIAALLLRISALQSRHLTSQNVESGSAP